jgi:nicotinamidase-related amidase
MAVVYGPVENAIHLCVDMQRLFVEATPWHAPWANRVMPAVAALCERRPERTLFTRFIPAAAPHAAVGTWRRYYSRWPEMTRDRLPAETLDLAVPLQHFAPPATVFDKHVYSPWWDGRLSSLLAERGVGTLVISGLETEVCVLATVLGGIDHGFRVVIAADAICSSADETHDAMRRIYDSRFGMQVEVAETEEILAAWQED